MRPAPKPLPEAQAAELKELVGRRQQLIALRTAEHNRLERAASPAVRRSLRDHVAWLDERLAEVDRDIDRRVRTSPLWRTREDLLRSVPGIRPVVAATLLVGVPELGHIGPKPLAALLGVAPHPRASGRRQGPRHVAGARARVRAVLYMATVAALRWNPDIRACYRRLLAAGKLPKVALVACMRHLLLTLNALLRDGRYWEDRSTSLAA